jgi:CBS domain-containing protein
MSPRAAWRLESIGFTRVYDYVAGKADWGSFALPLEGRNASRTRASSIVRADAPTCRLDEQVAEVAARLPAEWDVCVVANDERVVLGLLGRGALRAGGDVRVEEAMTPGPSTVRPSARLDPIANRMRDENLTCIVVTRSDGVLVGVLRREDVCVQAERRKLGSGLSAAPLGCALPASRRAARRQPPRRRRPDR